MATFAVLASASFVTIAPTPAAAAPVTAAFLDAEPGDSIFIYGTQSFSNVTLAPGSTSASVQLNLQVHLGTWQVVLSAPTGEILAPGTYGSVDRLPSPGRAGLDVSGGGRSCTTVTGRFLIDEITFAGPAVQSLSARFEQHCNGATPALFGAVSFNGSAPYRARYVPGSMDFYTWNTGDPVAENNQSIYNYGPSPLSIGTGSFSGPGAASFQLVGPSCLSTTLPSGTSCPMSFRFVPTGSPGEKVAVFTLFDDLAPAGGSGRRISLRGTYTDIRKVAFFDWEARDGYQGTTSSFTQLYLNGGASGLTVSAFSPGHFVHVSLGPRTGGTLTTGAYENAAYVADSTHPRMDISDCYSGSYGRFVIDEIAFNGSGVVTKLAARIENHCNGLEQAMFGSISFDSTLPYRERTVVPDSLDFGSVFFGQVSAAQQVTVRNNGPSTLALGSASITGVNAPSFQLLTNSCSNATLAASQSCTFSVRFTPTGLRGQQTARLTFFDDLAPIGGGGRDVILTGLAQSVPIPHVGFADSEEDDWIGNGDQVYYTNGTVNGNAQGIQIVLGNPTWSGAQPFLGINLAPRTGGTLGVGAYEDAQRSADANHPKLEVSSSGRACNSIGGRFVIDDVAYGTDGTVDRASVHLEQHCERGDDALFVVVVAGSNPVAPMHSIEPDWPLFFEDRGLGGRSAPQDAYVTNPGSLPLHIASVELSGADGSQFDIVSDACSGAVLPRDGSCRIRVVFAPTADPGDKVGLLSVFDDVALPGGTGRDVILVGTSFQPGRRPRTDWDSAPFRRSPFSGGSGSLSTGQAQTAGSSAVDPRSGSAVIPTALPAAAVPILDDPRFTG